MVVLEVRAEQGVRGPLSSGTQGAGAGLRPRVLGMRGGSIRGPGALAPGVAWELPLQLWTCPGAVQAQLHGLTSRAARYSQSGVNYCMRHMNTEGLFVVHLKFKFNWVHY